MQPRRKAVSVGEAFRNRLLTHCLVQRCYQTALTRSNVESVSGKWRCARPASSDLDLSGALHCLLIFVPKIVLEDQQALLGD